MDPSTKWRETIAPDEETRFEDYARQFAEMQRRKSARHGRGRALHRKQILALRGVLEVFTDLPPWARHGLFATPGPRDAWVRLSNGGPDRAPDAAPDIRGFAIKAFGVKGPGALGQPEVDHQDFLLINHSAFAFPKSDEFVGLVMAASRGNGALLKHLLSRYGLVGGLRLAARFAKTMGQKFSGFATETFYSAAPLACGPYACRVRLLPPPAERPAHGADRDWARDMMARLEHDTLGYELQLQFFVDESVTPIEDASVDWPEEAAPYVPVGRLHLPSQWFDDVAAADFAAQVENAVFDPWSGLLDHRPLGDVMRARKVVYFASEKGRDAL